MNNTLTTTELIGMHDELIAEERAAKTIANIERRAKTLWADGYRLNWDGRADESGINFVYGPKGQMYQVTICDDAAPVHECDCPAFAKFGTCKHYLAVKKVIADELQAAAFDALMAGAETATGLDPFAEF